MRDHLILCQLCRSEVLYIIIITIIYHIFVIDYRLGVEKRIKISWDRNRIVLHSTSTRR